MSGPGPQGAPPAAPRPAAGRRGDAAGPAPWVRRAVGALLFLGTFLVLAWAQADMGIPRDEAVYFDAGASYAAWFGDLASDPGAALSEPGIRRRFEVNREHPALPKILFGLSHALFTDGLGWTDHRLGFRLPALVLSALLILGTFLLGLRTASWRAGLFAGLAMLVVPRHFFHYQLAAFDVPVTTAWVWVVLAWRRALEPDARPRHHLTAGLLFGVALALKHNAYFLGPLLVLHWLLTRAPSPRAAGGLLGWLARVPKAVWAMMALGPVVVFGTWPFLWHAPVERFGWYLAFHARHVHYSWQYLGEVLRRPPFPVAYPFVVTGLTVPVGILGAMVLGLGMGFGGLLRGGLRGRPGPGEGGLLRSRAPQAASDRLLLGLNALFPLALIALPSVPIFGGMKHWLPAMPFLAVGAGAAVEAVATAVAPRLRRAAFAGLATLLLVPAAMQTAHFQPYGTSAYNTLAGGLPGAASLGMQRQYWSNAVTGVLPWINAHLRPGSRLFLHEVTPSAFRWYQRDGLLRDDLRPAWNAQTSDAAAWQFHQEFRDQELELRSAYGTPRPATVLTLDSVPLIVVYARPSAVLAAGD